MRLIPHSTILYTEMSWVMEMSEDIVKTEMGDGDTWILISALAELTYVRLDIRHASTSGFHANVWNEHDMVRP